MKFADILAKLKKGEELTDPEKEFLKNYDLEKDKNDAAAAARRKAEEDAATAKAEVEKLKQKMAEDAKKLEDAAAAKLTDAEKAAKELADLKKKLDQIEKAKVEADQKAAAIERSQKIRDAAKAAGITLAPKSVSESLFYQMLEATLANVDIANETAMTEALTKFKGENPGIISAQGAGSGVNGGNPTGAQTSKNPWAKESLNVTEQVKLFSQDPERARTLAAAAGVRLGAE